MLTSSSGLSILFFCTFLLNKIQSVHLNLIQVLWTLALSYGELPFTQHSICTSTHLYISQVYNNHILPTHKLTTTQIKPILYNPTLKNQNVTTLPKCIPLWTNHFLRPRLNNPKFTTTPIYNSFCAPLLYNISSLAFQTGKAKLICLCDLDKS